MNFFEKSIETLELPAVLKMLSDQAVSASAKEQCLALKPSSEPAEVKVRIEETGSACRMMIVRGSPSFSGVRDIRPALSRADLGGALNCRELLDIAGVLRTSRLVKGYLSDDSVGQTGIDHLFHALRANKFLEEKILTSDGRPLGVSPFEEAKLSALTDEELTRLATPLRYDIRFETETYRSGKRHVKKTRYKENPFGKIVGAHEGAQFYTIGQRKGLGVGGHTEPVFVIATDTEANRVYVGEGHAHKGLSRFCLRVAPGEIHWIRTDLAMQPGEMRRYRVRIRYRQPLQSATLIRRESGLYILFDAPQRGISPGQFAVWYDGEEMLGSGVI